MAEVSHHSVHLLPAIHFPEFTPIAISAGWKPGGAFRLVIVQYDGVLQPSRKAAFMTTSAP